ncbi:hypothetical protein Q5424_00540 [Conexibacter sp. JD483]|uniref:hypothetical protein n=1 Tax=unclassified Conexibacter TaxID=2627773 RepID=UPI00271F8949|nr:MULTISPECIES: hypothetical protein [unclassified Conexibacter]MDO8184149.1 hypothetical protein [Conexibacter sp. CPCC 205706]MDO8197141.1 hypothetical protein [Conexibacter sp. CPCC 205762]MDR9367544.1 hypothetical protein [Conexibacter sp. JD483]
MRRRSLGVAVLAAAVAALAPSAASAATWSASTPVDPSGASASGLSGVSCTASTNCEAVGSTDGAALIERYSSGTWSQQTAATPPAGTVSSALDGVGCSASNACTAVGNYDDGSSTWALAERWTTAWALQTFPRPSGAQSSQLSGVACVTSTYCLAVGGYVDRSGVQQPLAATWNGTSWALQTVPLVSGSTGTALSGVTCASTTSCEVVGSYLDRTNTPFPTAAAYNGVSTWTLQSVPTPRGASATFISGLSCTSASACTAVGYATNATSVFAVAERWNGTGWAEQTLASAPAGSTGSALIGVSCTTSTTCNAVGYYIDSAGKQRSYSQTWTPWTVVSTPNPSVFDAAAVNGISCTSSTACISVGYFYDTSFSLLHPLAQRYS